MKPSHTCSSLFLAAALGAPFIYAEPPQKPVIAPLLQPLVDHHALAGAVTLVADKDSILDIEAVGYADNAARKPMTT